VRASVRDDPLFLRNVLGYDVKIFGGQSMWGSKGMLMVMAEKGAITRGTQIYVPSHPTHTPQFAVDVFDDVSSTQVLMRFGYSGPQPPSAVGACNRC
jgi:hypothetical protein